MTSVEFDRTTLEALLRATVLFKFEGGEDSLMYAGSPQYANGVTALLDGVVRAHREESRDGTARRWEDLYQLRNHPERQAWVHAYLRELPGWEGMAPEQRRHWADVVAAPYRISDDGYAALLD